MSRDGTNFAPGARRHCGNFRTAPATAAACSAARCGPIGRLNTESRHGFGQRKCSFFPASFGIGAGQMRGNGIVNQSSDARLRQMVLKNIALLMPDDKQVPDGLGPRGNKWQGQTGKAVKLSK